VLAQRLERLVARLVAGQEALAHPHRADRPRVGLLEPAPLEAHDLHAAAADVHPEAVAERGRVGDREVAVARLLLGRDHPHRQRGALGDRLEQLVAVGRVADRAGGDRLDLLDARRVAEVVEHLGGAQRPLHRLAPQLAVVPDPLADPDRLPDLVGVLPPAARLVAVDDEAERVRSEVGDGESFHPEDDGPPSGGIIRAACDS
jgi:hypothetical protein